MKKQEVNLEDPNASRPWPSEAMGWIAVSILTAAFVLSYIDRVVLGLLIELIRTDLQVSDTQVSLLGGLAFALFYVLMGLPLGRLADRANRRNLIAIGIAFWSTMTTLCGLAGSFWHLFLARVGVGIGEAALTPAALSMISDYFPPKKRYVPLAIYMSAIAVGSGLAYIAGATIIHWISGLPGFHLPLLGELKAWQATFVLVGLPGILMTLLVLTLKEPERRERKQTGGAQKNVPIKEVAAFIFKENNKTFQAILLAFGGIALHAAAIQLWLPAYYRRVFGWNETEIGLIYGAIILVFATTGMVGGAQLAKRLMKRGHQDALLRTPLIMACIMMPFSISVTLIPDPYLTLLCVVPVTILSFGIVALAPGMLQAITPNQMRGQVGAVFAFFNNVIGLMIGGTFVALLTDYVFGAPEYLGYSLSVTGIIFLPVSIWLMARGLKPFKESLDRAEAWQK